MQRPGDAPLEPILQFLGVDAVVLQLFADVVKGLGQAEHFLGALAAVRQRPLDAQETQVSLAGGRIGRLLVARLGGGLA